MGKSIRHPHTYVFKAMWRSTALLLKVDAKSPDHAQRLAEGRVLRMEGGSCCENVVLIRQIR